MLLITVGLAFILELLAVISSYFRIDRPFDTSDAAMAMVAVCEWRSSAVLVTCDLWCLGTRHASNIFAAKYVDLWCWCCSY